MSTAVNVKILKGQSKVPGFGLRSIPSGAFSVLSLNGILGHRGETSLLGKGKGKLGLVEMRNWRMGCSITSWPFS